MKSILSKLWPWQAQSSTVDHNSTTISMYSRRNNFEASHDVPSPLKYSEVLSLSCHHNIGNPETANKQKSRMPGLLRLNSIGEDSMVHHSKDSGLKKTTVRSSPKKSKSGDSFIASWSRPLFSKMGTTMTTKAVAPMNFNHRKESVAPFFKSKSHSFSEVLQNSRTSSMGSLGVKGYLGSSFDSCQGSVSRAPYCRQLPTNSFKMQTLNPWMRSVSDSEVKNTSANDMTGGMKDSSVNILHVPLSSVFISAVTSSHTNSTSSVCQPVTNIPAQSHPSVSSKQIVVPQSSVHNSSVPQKMPDNNQRNCDISIVHSELSPSGPKSATTFTSEHPEDCGLFSEKICSGDYKLVVTATEKASSPSLTVPAECQREHYDHNPEENVHGKPNNHQESNMKISPPGPAKQVVCLTSVLLTPRRTTKKGRPSSKKQKKRQREKQKQIAHSSPLKVSSEKSESAVESSQENSSIVFQTSDESANSADCVTDSSSQHSQQKQSTPIKKACHFLFLPNSDEDDDAEDDDYNTDSSDWSTDESFGGCISPIKGVNFSVALNIDSIFKQNNIPSLKSVLSHEDSESDSELATPEYPSDTRRKGLHVMVQVNHSEDENRERNADCSAPSPSSSLSDHALFGFTAGLCLDNIFKKKLPTGTADVESITHLVDNFTFKDAGQSSDSSQMTAVDSEKMDEINAKWDRFYSTAGSCSCHSVSSGIVTDSSIKVRFAADPNLHTVHEVGDEDRAGTWHLFALDRERFSRRIQEVEDIVGPVLADSHRRKIFQRNQHLEGKMSDNNDCQ